MAFLQAPSQTPRRFTFGAPDPAAALCIRRASARLRRLTDYCAAVFDESVRTTDELSRRVRFLRNELESRSGARRPPQPRGVRLMKFRRIACDCCKRGDAPSLCQAPTYVVSEVTDNSNVIFVLITKRGRTLSCEEALVESSNFGGLEPQSYELAQSELGDEAFGRRAEAIIDDAAPDLAICVQRRFRGDKSRRFAETSGCSRRTRDSGRAS